MTACILSSPVDEIPKTGRHHRHEKTTCPPKTLCQHRAMGRWRPIPPLAQPFQRAGRINAYWVHSPRRYSKLMALLLSALASTASKSLTPEISVLAIDK